MKMSRLTRDRTAEPISRDQILRRERGQGNIDFPCSADHEQDWQPYPVDPYSSCYMCDHTYILSCTYEKTRYFFLKLEKQNVLNSSTLEEFKLQSME